jgi:hypothetical protein
MDGGILTETVQMIDGACQTDISSHRVVLMHSSGRDKTDFGGRIATEPKVAVFRRVKRNDGDEK